MSPRRPLQAAVGVLVALSAAWALTSPLGSVPDEPAHVLYAAAVVRGDLGSGERGQSVTVPASVAAAGGITCTAFLPSSTADCLPALPDRTDPTGTVTGAGRYPPLYYALVGWPTRLGFGEATWYGMRLLSVALGGLLLALATATWCRSPAPVVAGVLIAGTPMLAFLLGSVNPNGVEIAAGVAVTLAALGLADTAVQGGRPGLRQASALVLLVLYLALARPGSYLLAAALVGTLAVAASTVVRVRPRAATGLLVACAAAVLAGVAAARLVALPAAPQPAAAVAWEEAARVTAQRAFGWWQETIGMFGWRDHQVPAAFSLVWLALVAGLLLTAVLRGRAAERLSLLGLTAGAVVAAPFFVFVTLFRDGVGYQGRYAMALTQAIPVLAGAVLARRGGAGLPWRLIAPTTAALGVLALVGSGLRYGVGLPLPPAGALAGQVLWVPPAWPVVVLLCLFVLGLTGWLAVRTRSAAEAHRAARASIRR